MGLRDKVKALRRVGGRQGPSCSAGNSDTSKRRRWPKNLRHCQTASHWSVTTARLQYFELQTSASCTARTTHFNWKAQTQTTAARSPQCGSAVKIASVWLQVNENFNTLKKNVLKDKKITVKMNQKCQLSKNQAVSLAVTKWILLSSFAIFYACTNKARFLYPSNSTMWVRKEKRILWWHVWDQLPVCHYFLPRMFDKWQTGWQLGAPAADFEWGLMWKLSDQ